MDKKLFEFVSKTTNEKILEYKKCKWCNDEYPIYEREKKFIENHNFEISDLCFDCRYRNMLLWRNEKKLYWRKSDKSGKKILSLYSPEYESKVYNYDEWESEGGFSHINMDFDGKNFIENFYELFKKVPKAGTDIFWTNENIHYCNRVGYLKNAYSTYACFGDSEDVYFSINISNSKDIYNSTKIDKSNLVYDSVMVYNSYEIFFSDAINNCKNIYFSYDLRDCEECIFCSNLVGKKYMIYNKQYEKNKYEKIKENLKQNTASYKGLEKLLNDFENLKIKAIRRGTYNIGGDKVLGDQLNNGHDTLFGFRMDEPDDCFNSANGFPAIQKKVYNSFGFGMVENMSFGQGNGPGTNLHFTLNVQESSDIYFSQKMKGCHNCIGCYGLQNSDYHILNKAFSKEDYEKLFPIMLENIKKNGGLRNYFEPEKSPYPINDCQLFIEFPAFSIRKIIGYKGGEIDKYNFEEQIFDKNGKGIVYILYPEKDISEAIFDLGGQKKVHTKWKNKETEIDIPDGMIKIEVCDIKDYANDIDENILNCAIPCIKTGRYFRTIRKEIEFCKKYNIALSRVHPNKRIDDRRKRSPKLGLELTNCKICSKEILSAYDKNSLYNIVCEECYEKQVY
nr:hypothetical protein [Candidatus Gracilibacteria bacterium]